MERMASGVFEAQDTALISALAEFLRRNVESSPSVVAANHESDSVELLLASGLKPYAQRRLDEMSDALGMKDKNDTLLVAYALTMAVARLKRLGLWRPEVRVGN